MLFFFIGQPFYHHQLHRSSPFSSSSSTGDDHDDDDDDDQKRFPFNRMFVYNDIKVTDKTVNNCKFLYMKMVMSSIQCNLSILVTSTCHHSSM
ncbi:hypothetical protein DERF_013551 [Dermatophagoides farinae]|uniref:Uncharacterized protein n=1 Tax=Dermatophagoides farinae TaxID=6954 RepID=A0A922HME2_DERFA|nr:hypothetical protein DERF_013551 [Dermatophagoides farinae]